MANKKNYLKYYKKIYFNNRNSSIKRKFIVLFAFLLFTTIFVVFSIFVKIENSKTDELNETSLAANRAVNLKRKKLRTDFSCWNKSCEWNLFVINNVNELPEYFEPKLKQCRDIEVDERIVFSLNEMLQEASKNGIKLWVSSGYRSKERQKQLFDREFEENLKLGATKDEAFSIALEKISLPGNNEHNSGLAVDFNAAGEEFCQTQEYEWLLENCTNYGFILRYSREKEDITGRAFEPAHFRYVGEEHAQKMRTQNLCLEEYISNLIK